MNLQQTDLGLTLKVDSLPDIHAPQTNKAYTAPEEGVDNLGISSIDKFQIKGVGEFSVNFDGFVRVARSQPTETQWEGCEVYTNLIELRMIGTSEEMGSIIVSLNKSFRSAGQIRSPFTNDGPTSAKSCRMAVGAVFEIPRMGLTLFNKEPIELTIDNVTSIPPAGAPGVGRIYEVLPLYDMNHPQSYPVAYLTALTFTMGSYISMQDIERIRSMGMTH